MQFLRRHRLSLVFLALLIFCSAMVLRQFMANESKHVEVREAFILLYSKGYRPDAERLYKRLLRDLETLPSKVLKEDYRRTVMLVDSTTQQQENLIWKYYATVSNELKHRSESTLDAEQQSENALMRARKLAEEGK